MSINSLKFKRLFIVSCLLLTTALPIFASENIISSVTISKSKENSNSYELNIDSTKMVKYKSHIDGNDNVYFDLKNSTLASNLGTIYDDVSTIDNVVVKQIDKNNVRIYITGQNARNTELVFVNSLFETQDNAKKIVINRPIKQYRPTTIEQDLEDQTEIQDWSDNSFNFSHLSTTFLSDLKDGNSGKVLIIVSLFLMLIGILKTLSMKLSQDREPLIGLNSKNILNANLNNQFSLNNIQKRQKELQAPTRSEALKQAQAELAKAHQKYQQYIQNKYQGVSAPKSIDVDSLKKSIALNQYQKSTQNPYKNQEVIRINKGYSTDIQNKSGNYQIPPRPQKTRQEFTSPYIQRTNKFIDTSKRPNNNVIEQKTNLKFLDSVTKIYERSGRADLADELKNSISKARQSI